MPIPGWAEGTDSRVVTEQEMLQVIMLLKAIKDGRVAFSGDMVLMAKRLAEQNAELVAKILGVLGVK
jgi:hypothetical protein